MISPSPALRSASIRHDGNAAVRLNDLKTLLKPHASLAERVLIENDMAVGVLDQGRFTSRFVPVNTLVTQDDQNLGGLQGWRANVVAYDNAAFLVSSAAFFAGVSGSSLLVSLDRMTRTLHAMNYEVSGLSGLLFLPVHERLLNSVRHDHGKYFATLLLSLGLNPSGIVIEIPSSFSTQPRFLDYLVSSYRRHGFRVALQLPSGIGSLAAVNAAPVDYLIVDADDDTSPTFLAQLTAEAETMRPALLTVKQSV